MQGLAKLKQTRSMLKKFTLIVILSVGFIFRSHGQAVAHKPAELLKIMKDSKLTYTIGEMYIDIPEKDYSNYVNSPDIYHEDSDGHMVVKKLVLAKEAEGEWKLAEKAFLQDKNYKEARKHYKNVTEIQPDYYPAKIQTAKTYEQEDDNEKAIMSYKQAISKNFVDYLPHWLIAEAYLRDKNYDGAIDEITLASVLNRNDTSILQDMTEIYVRANLKYDDWEFNPQYTIFKGQKQNEIKVL
jgi:tetratricopeptide (TPR) repeat protein